MHQGFAYKRLKSMEKIIPTAKKWLWSLMMVGHLQQVLIIGWENVGVLDRWLHMEVGTVCCYLWLVLILNFDLVVLSYRDWNT